MKAGSAKRETVVNRYLLMRPVRDIHIACSGLDAVAGVLSRIETAVELGDDSCAMAGFRHGLVDAVTGLTTMALDRIETLREMSGIGEDELWEEA